MKKTLLCHFYNEEYLLPWFLKQHKNMFDHGIMINYASTDNSTKIIKEICPSWEIIDSRNEWFAAVEIDREVMDIESSISGWKLCLNVTEHLLKLEELPDVENTVFGIECYKMVDDNPNILPTYDRLLTEQKITATNHCTNTATSGTGKAGFRYIHSFNRGLYTVGRHDFNHTYTILNTSKIAKYMFSPWNEHFIKRKLQIGDKVPDSDIHSGMGGHHKNPKEIWELEYSNHLVNLFKII